MNIVALSCSGHESGATFLLDGKLHETILEERLTTIKKDKSLHAVFERIGAFHEKYGIDKIISTNGTDADFEYTKEALAKFGLNKDNIDLEEEWEHHHLYHATSGFYASGFDEAVCLVADGWGADFRIVQILELLGRSGELSEEENEELMDLGRWMFLETTSIYDMAYPCETELLFKNLLIPHPQPSDYLEKNPFPYMWLKEFEHSELINCSPNYDIGMLYGLITRHLGFEDNEQCGKTMGLAGYGRPNKKLPDFILETGLTDMNFAFSDMKVNTHNFPSMEHNDDFQHRADIAYKLQQHTEDILRMRINQIFHLKPDVKNIIFSGGCALNICANSVIQEEYPDINFFIDPVAGDACQSYGAAKYYYYKETGSMMKDPMTTTYYGPHQPSPAFLKKQIEFEVAKHNEMRYTDKSRRKK
tara:strand:+ start:631 stop:1884 length:1254 start_codon:yes stop_codon:yes gene_type:complete